MRSALLAAPDQVAVALVGTRKSYDPVAWQLPGQLDMAGLTQDVSCGRPADDVERHPSPDARGRGRHRPPLPQP